MMGRWGRCATAASLAFAVCSEAASYVPPGYFAKPRPPAATRVPRSDLDYVHNADGRASLTVPPTLEPRPMRYALERPPYWEPHPDYNGEHWNQTQEAVFRSSEGTLEAEEAAQMKLEMANRLGGSHWDADFVVDRKTTVPPGYRGEAMLPGHWRDLAPDDGVWPTPPAPSPGPGPGPFPGPGPAPGPSGEAFGAPSPASCAPGPGPCPSPAPAPLPSPVIGVDWSFFRETELPTEVAHNDGESFEGDWLREFGPDGPQGGQHGAFQGENVKPHLGQGHFSHFMSVKRSAAISPAAVQAMAAAAAFSAALAA